MIGFDEAEAFLAAAVKPLSTEEVALIDAHGRVLAKPVFAALSSPRRDVSAMDGFAVRDADAAVGARFHVIGESFAGGEMPPRIEPNEAVRIFTGAAMPEGADRVIMQENCSLDDQSMTIMFEYGRSGHVRKAASDFAVGDLLLPPGRLLDPRAIVVLAGADQASAIVYRRPRVAIIATGDELASPGTALTNPLKIPESVSFGVAAMAEQFGASVVARYSGGDDLPGLRRLADKALAEANVVIVTGGASVGERDYAKAMFAEHELELLFEKVAIKPGKPVWLGRAQGRWVLGLPGNPISAMVTARLFLGPLLVGLQGRAPADVLNWETRPLANAFKAGGERTCFVRASLSPDGVSPIVSQDSGAQAALTQAEFLVRLDPGDEDHGASSLMQTLRF